MAIELEIHKVRFSTISISYPVKLGFIWSDTRGETISTNGFHIGVSFQNIVYCNVHPYGLLKEEWLNDFHGVGPRTVIETDFGF